MQGSQNRLEEVSGWVVFAGMMLVIVGFFTIIDGLVALFNDQAFGAIGGQLIIFDFTQWGWIHLILGIALVLTGYGLFAQSGWARWTAVFLAALNAVTQISLINVTPFWSLAIITIDIIIIYQLTARWVPAEP